MSTPHIHNIRFHFRNRIVDTFTSGVSKSTKQEITDDIGPQTMSFVADSEFWFGGH